jgi:hypothetical protein
MSHHAFLGMGSATNTFFKSIDNFMSGDVAGIVKQRDAVAPKTEMVLNEWIPFLTGADHFNISHVGSKFLSLPL